jgi:outer membrane protein TolC
MMRIYIALWLLIAATHAGAAPLMLSPSENPQVISLKEAVGLGLKNNESVKRAQAQVGIAEGQRSLAWSGLWPHLNALGKLSVPNFAPSKTTMFDKFGGLTAHWTMIDIASWMKIRGSAHQLAAKESEYNFAQMQLIRDIARAYLSVIREQSLRDLAKLEMDEYEPARFKTQKNLAAAGLSTKLDLNRAEYHFNKAHSDFLSKQHSYDNSLAELGQLIGVTENFTIDAPQLASEYFSSPNEMLLELAWARPDFLALQAKLRQTEANIKQEVMAFLPKISSEGRVGYSNEAPGGINAPLTLGASVGVMIEIPLFSGGSTLAQMKTNRFEKALTELSITEQKRQAMLAIAGLKNAVTTLEAIEASATAALNSATEAKESAMRLFKENEATSLELMEAQLNYFTAKDHLLQAQLRSQENKIDLLFAVGKMGELAK